MLFILLPTEILIHSPFTVRPEIESFNLPPSVQMGQRLSITCTVVKGDPPISIRWLRDEYTLKKDGDIRIHDLADYSSTLLFDPIKPEHRANYTCVATNEAGSDRHSAAMVIHGMHTTHWQANEFFLYV